MKTIFLLLAASCLSSCTITKDQWVEIGKQAGAAAISAGLPAITGGIAKAQANNEAKAPRKVTP